ncbi:MAG TPA: alpha/beta hydrolase [Candidatus Saccharimonadia bacterium]|jgi:pimeloyl-ACP methyl ester carboxylesterase
MREFSNWLIHKALKRPYPLHVRLDSGKGRTVLLLHGLGASGRAWEHVVRELEGAPVRLVVLDMLGFGDSPKPTDPWVNYSAEDQARAVIRALKRHRVRGPITIVGHSMGCLVAVEVATMRPRLVRDLLLYEPPFYVGLPPKNKYRLRLKAYFVLFNAILKRPPKDPEGFRRIQRLIGRRYHFELTPENWVPFERSLRNAIMQQTALTDLKGLRTPTQILYGTRDRLVINDKKNLFFNGEAEHITSDQVREQHRITPRASGVIAKLVLGSGN